MKVSLARSRRTWLSGLLLLAVLAGLGCAQNRSVQRSLAVSEPRVVLEKQGMGYRVELPEDWSFLAGNLDEHIVARGEDRVVIRLFPEHFSTEPTPEECWERLFTRLPEDLESAPESPSELTMKGPNGLDRLGGRRIYMAPYPREESCMVLMIEGPDSGSRLDEVARVALGSFVLAEPAESMRTRLAFDAGSQLLELGDPEAALRRFEEVLKREPELVRAYLGAGLAAVMSGDAAAPKAVSYLESYLEMSTDQLPGRMGQFEWMQIRDALMHLGIAYAVVEDYANARSRLAEFTVRFPEDAVGQYNFACVLSLSGELEMALDHLELSFQMDPSLIEHARSDEDLIPLHGIPRYQELVSAETPTAADAKIRAELDD